MWMIILLLYCYVVSDSFWPLSLTPTPTSLNQWSQNAYVLTFQHQIWQWGEKCPCQLGALRYVFWEKEAEHTTGKKRNQHREMYDWWGYKDNIDVGRQTKPRLPMASAPHTHPEGTNPETLQTSMPINSGLIPHLPFHPGSILMLSTHQPSLH